MGNLADDMRAWMQAPFTSQMDVLHVFLLTGLVIVSAILWSRIVRRLEE